MALAACTIVLKQTTTLATQRPERNGVYSCRLLKMYANEYTARSARNVPAARSRLACGRLAMLPRIMAVANTGKFSNRLACVASQRSYFAYCSAGSRSCRLFFKPEERGLRLSQRNGWPAVATWIAYECGSTLHRDCERFYNA
jgi:hypothetical protein